MRRGEKARFAMRPEYGYASKDCAVAPPRGCARDEAFLFDIHLVPSLCSCLLSLRLS